LDIPPSCDREDEFRVESAWNHKGEFPMTQHLDYTAIAPAGIKALGSVYGYIVQSGLPRQLGESGLSARLADQRLRLLHRHALA
jgi:hypothetical protein